MDGDEPRGGINPVKVVLMCLRILIADVYGCLEILCVYV